MASKLKNRRQQQKAELAESESVKKEGESSEAAQIPDRGSSTNKEEGDEFFAPPNIASKIAQRRLPRRTPTSHVKGIGSDLIRRRLSKTNEQPGSLTKRYTIESSFEQSLDKPELKPPIRQQTVVEDPEPEVVNVETKK